MSKPGYLHHLDCVSKELDDLRQDFTHRFLSFISARLVEYTRADGTVGRRVKPYIIDLGSGNGTFLNNKRIEPQRYYELKEKDVLIKRYCLCFNFLCLCFCPSESLVFFLFLFLFFTLCVS